MLSSVYHARSQSADSLVNADKPAVDTGRSVKQNLQKSKTTSEGIYDNLNSALISKSNHLRNPNGIINYPENPKDSSQRNSSYPGIVKPDATDPQRNQSYVEGTPEFLRDSGRDPAGLRSSARARPSMGVSGSLYSKKFHSTESIAAEEEVKLGSAGNPLSPRGAGMARSAYNIGPGANPNQKQTMFTHSVESTSDLIQNNNNNNNNNAPTSTRSVHLNNISTGNPVQSNFISSMENPTTSPRVVPDAGNSKRSPLGPTSVEYSKHIITTNGAYSKMSINLHPQGNSTKFPLSPTSAVNRQPGLLASQFNQSKPINPINSQSVNNKILSPRINGEFAQEVKDLESKNIRSSQNHRVRNQVGAYGPHIVENQTKTQPQDLGVDRSRNIRTTQRSNQVDEVDASRSGRSRVSRSNSALVGNSSAAQGPRVRVDGSGGRVHQPPPTGRPIVTASNPSGHIRSRPVNDTENKQKYEFKVNVRSVSKTNKPVVSGVNSQRSTVPNEFTVNNSRTDNKITFVHKAPVNPLLKAQGKKAVSSMDLHRQPHVTFQIPVTSQHRRDQSLPERDSNRNRSAKPALNPPLKPSRSVYNDNNAGLVGKAAVEISGNDVKMITPLESLESPTRHRGILTKSDDLFYPAALSKSALTHYFSNPELNLSPPAPSDDVELRRLRQLLADREYELSSVRETFAENEKAILRVLEERSRAWRQESSARQVEWEKSLAGHIERSLQHDSTMRQQLADSQHETQQALNELQQVKIQLSELQKKFNSLKSDHDAVTAENFRLKKSLDDAKFSPNFVPIEKLNENGKLGVWSVVGRTAQVTEVSSKSRQVMFKPIVDTINSMDENSQFDESSESEMGSLAREVRFRTESNGYDDLVFPEREGDHAQIATAAELLHPGFRSTPRRPPEYRTPSNSSLSSSSQHSRDGAVVEFSRLSGHRSSSSSRHSRDGAADVSHRDECNNRLNSNRRRVTFGVVDDEISQNGSKVSDGQLCPKRDGWKGSSTHDSGFDLSASSPQDTLAEQKIKSLTAEVERAKENLAKTARSFESEREQWLREKEQVINYQSTLQQDYIRMANRNKELEQKYNRVSYSESNL